MDEFSELSAEILSSSNNSIITGDFNIHVNDGKSVEAVNFIEMMTSLGLDQLIDYATHKAGNTLDLVFQENINEVSVQQHSPGPYLSDHCIIKFTLNKKQDEVKLEYIVTRKLKGVNVEKLFHEIELPEIDQDMQVEDAVEKVEEAIKKALDKLAPQKRRRVTIRKKNPWYNEEIRTLKQQVRRKERLFRKYKSKELWLALVETKTIFKKALYKAKKNSICEKIYDCGKNTKQLYRLVAELTGTTKSNPLPEAISDEQLASEFANFFLGKIQKIRDKLENQPKYQPTEENTEKMSHFEPVSEQEVKRIINSMASKSCELDPLPAKILKTDFSHCISVITCLVNLSLTKGVFPEKWKVAIVHPLMKKLGLELIINNYKPVSNLSFLSKVLEKAALLRLSDHCNANSLMPDYQSAYRANYSCETALVKLCNDILWGMEVQHLTPLVAIDLSTPFDTVDHEVLLQVLQRKFGINGSALKWFDSYLRPRGCKVNIGELLAHHESELLSTTRKLCWASTLPSLCQYTA